MALLFTQAVFLDSSKATSDLASALLMCDASGSEHDSGVCWELLCPSGSVDSAQLWPPFLLFCWGRSKHNLQLAGMRQLGCTQLEQGAVLSLLSSSLGAFSFPAGWWNVDSSNGESRKELMVAWEIYRTYQHVEQQRCHVSEKPLKSYFNVILQRPLSLCPVAF